jgi:signal transduction histidine kinase
MRVVGRRWRQGAIAAAVVGVAGLALATVLQVAWSWEARREATRRAVQEHLLRSTRLLGDEILRISAERRWQLLSVLVARPAEELARPEALAELEAHAGRLLDETGLARDPHRGAFRIVADQAAGGGASAFTGALRDGALARRVSEVARRRVREAAPEYGLPAAVFLETPGVDALNVLFARVRGGARVPDLLVGLTYDRARAVANTVRAAEDVLPPPPAALASTPRAGGTRLAERVRLGSEGRFAPERATSDAAGTPSVRFLTKGGAVLYESAGTPAARWRSAYHARVTYDSRPGGFVLELAMDEAAGDALVRAAVPSGERWLLGAVVALVAVLAATGVASLRRERELERLRARFIASVSHELRTPLTEIALYSDTLLRGVEESPAQARRWLTMINREAHRLGAMVGSILVAARDESDHLRVVPRDCDVAQLTRDAVLGMQLVARARQSVVRVAAPDAMPAHLDPDAFRQVLLNLVDNALKYGPEGQTVTVALHDARARRSRALVLTVDDEGAGVPPGDRARVWQAFERLPAHDAVAGGSGLGLSVVRTLVALHGGRVWIDEAPSGGARFGAEFPDGAPVPA